jgi:hypothetical protein
VGARVNWIKIEVELAVEFEGTSTASLVYVPEGPDDAFAAQVLAKIEARNIALVAKEGPADPFVLG